MADLLKDIEQFLIIAGKATADGLDIFRDNLPDAPDKVIVLSEYDGLAASFGSEALDRSVQVLVRASTYTEARRTCWELYGALVDPIAPIKDFTPIRWGIVSGRTSPRKMNIDSQNRIAFVFNIGITTLRD